MSIETDPAAPPEAGPAAQPATEPAAPPEAGGSGAHRRKPAGRDARKAVPRSSHEALESGSERADPVAILEEQARTRVPELVPIRHGRMLASPFAFFRGAAAIMAADLAGTPDSGIVTQLCGDAHLSNFGLFASPERRLLFDVNDFDETLPGPWEWDVKRLAASLEIAARDREFSKGQRRRAVLSGVRGYRTEMRALAGVGHLDAWYRHMDVDVLFATLGSQLTAPTRRRTQQVMDKARSRDNLQALRKLTTVVDGQVRIVADPPLLVPIEDLIDDEQAQNVTEWLQEVLTGYSATLRPDIATLLARYEFVHLARKVVGVGSVGTRAWIALHQGRDGQDPLFLQAKEAEASVLERYLAPSAYDNHGQRVVAGQILMQAASDIFLGWTRTVGTDGVTRDFYLRQLRDWKGSLDLATVVPDGLAAYAELCGATLARAHARAGDRFAIAGYLGASDVFDNAVEAFARAYADLNERDYASFRAAVGSGRIDAVEGL